MASGGDTFSPATATRIALHKFKRVVYNRFIDEIVLEKLIGDVVFSRYLSFWARIVVVSRKPFIIGVTGSVGKTTTVSLIAAMLSHPAAANIVGRVRWTESNMNDDLGLPLTILGYDDWLWWRPARLLAIFTLPFRAIRLAFSSAYPGMLVLEYGTHAKGHLHQLVRLAAPDIAVVTTIGPAHLQRLKTVEGVIMEKGALVKATAPSGLVILGDNHCHVKELEQMARCEVVKVTGHSVQLSAAIAGVISRRLHLPEQVLTDALAHFSPPGGRLTCLHLSDMTIIDDSYNANPMSMKLGLDTVFELAQAGRRRVAILGFMGELGDDGPRYHEEISDYARGRVDIIIGVGILARHYRPDHWFENSESCAAAVGALLRAGDCVLVKGSHSAKMGRIVEAMRSEQRGQNFTPG